MEWIRWITLVTAPTGNSSQQCPPPRNVRVSMKIEGACSIYPNTPCMESLHTTEDQPLYVLCVLSCQCYGVSQIHFLLATAGAWEIPTAGCPSHAPNFARKRIIESIPCPPEKPRVFELIRSLHWWFETRRSVFETARLVTQKGGLSFVAGGKLFL